MSNIVQREDGQVTVLDFGLSSTRDLAGTTGARAPAGGLAPSVEELKSDPAASPPAPVVKKPEPAPAGKEPVDVPVDKLEKLVNTIRLTMRRNGIITGDSKKFDYEYGKMVKWHKRSNHSKALLFGKRALATLRSVQVNKAFVQDKLLRLNRYFDKSFKRMGKKAAIRQLDDLSRQVMAALEAGEYNTANKLLNRFFRIVK